jgi:hypothetical protein
MHTIQTQRGPLEIADTRVELDAWSLTRCLGWLVANDPNGEWAAYVDDFDRAVADCGDLSDVDARDAVWL